MQQAREVIALDVGEKRTGIARASTVARIAEPLMIVETSDALPALVKLCQEHELEAIVVGLPRSLSGNDTEQTKWVRHWVEDAKTAVKVPFYWQDEALTSKIAESRGGGNRYSDDEAASIILQDFLDQEESERQRC